MSPSDVRLRTDLPFRRIAVVLSGGGALGAYEVGVLRVLERVGLRPAIVAGVSVGAINSVAWMAHDFHTRVLEHVWKRLRPVGIGMRWTTLALRAAGGLAMVFAALEVVLTLAGSREMSLARWVGAREHGNGELLAMALDVFAWAMLGIAGGLVVATSRHIEHGLSKLSVPSDPQRLHRRLGWVLLAGVAIHAGTLAAGIPWPHRFSATVLVLGGVVWLVNRPGHPAARVRELLIRVLPETGGRGLWGATARRRLLGELVGSGVPGRLLDGNVHLIVSACALGTGRMAYFVNWPDPSPEFRSRVQDSLSEVVVMRDVADVIDATLASSSLPMLFEPVRIRGREYVDGGVFSNQPLHAVIADDADAVLVVLLAPSEPPTVDSKRMNLVELGGRLLELGNWRDLQTELRSLPGDWSREGSPARMCVVEPDRPLEGGLLGFDPALARSLLERGERDGLKALERAGWIVPVA